MEKTNPIKIQKDISKEDGRDIFVPEMIFGMLLTGSNYTKQNKTVGGKNGLGAKLANIFSKSFKLETVDEKERKKYTQSWSDNMYTKGVSTITKYMSKPYTKITFIPDVNGSSVFFGKLLNPCITNFLI